MFDTVLNMSVLISTQSNLYFAFILYCIRHIQNSGIFKNLFIQVYAGIFKHIQHYYDIFTHIEALLGHNQGYSDIFSNLCKP